MAEIRKQIGVTRPTKQKARMIASAECVRGVHVGSNGRG
jgi:hypothetical protein